MTHRSQNALCSLAFLLGFIRIPLVQRFCNYLYYLVFGVRTHIKTGVRIDCPWNITLGEKVYIGEYSFLAANSPITIGSNVIMGHRVSVITREHDIKNRAVGTDWMTLGYSRPITIGSGCYIGSGVIILKGVSLGESVVIGAGVVVRQSVPSGVVR